jgi:hypothetical protein
VAVEGGSKHVVAVSMLSPDATAVFFNEEEDNEDGGGGPGTATAPGLVAGGK